MAQNRLNIIQTKFQDHSSFKSLSKNSRNNLTAELQAKFERLWLIEPERFNPLRNCMERERLERTWQLLTKHINLVNKHTADIACGAGVFSRRLRDHGAQVEAVDIAENALKQFKKEGCDRIHLKRDTMPETTLPDHGFDLIICTELIGELPKEEHRLFFAELSRLIKPEGHLICSSAIDIDTEGGVEKLIELAQTEFDILEDRVSYHALYLRLKRFFEAPSLFIKGWKYPDIRQNELSCRKGINKWWYKLNSIFAFVWLWVICDLLFRPISRLLKNSSRLMLFLEKVCRFISDQDGISHFLFIAKRRPLKAIDPKEIPIEQPKRKQIWD